MVVDANAMGGFLVINPRSGRGSQAGTLRDEATRLGIETHLLGPDEDPADVARRAPHGPLGMASGDGCLAAVADVAIERGVPFVVVPRGTFNHFARDVGVDRGDPEAALRAFSGREKTVDVARVNGRLFLNNVSLGLYARLVHRSERGVDGSNVHARVVVFSNNHYTLDAFSLGERERLDEGALHVYVAHGWLPSTWNEYSLQTCTVEARAGRLEAAIDGEPTRLETPLRFELEPRALRVLLPESG
jgi:diacylglycerol kinase family enzyme